MPYPTETDDSDKRNKVQKLVLKYLSQMIALMFTESCLKFQILYVPFY